VAKRRVLLIQLKITWLETIVMAKEGSEARIDFFFPVNDA
jgi:hypothetical protein